MFWIENLSVQGFCTGLGALEAWGFRVRGFRIQG